MANIFALPKYIKATSPDGLRRLMFQVQMRDKMQYNFFDISFSNNAWFAWYNYEPKTDTSRIEEATDLTSKKE